LAGLSGFVFNPSCSVMAQQKGPFAVVDMMARGWWMHCLQGLVVAPRFAGLPNRRFRPIIPGHLHTLTAKGGLTAEHRQWFPVKKGREL